MREWDFDGRTAIVTGAVRDIGRTIAEMLARGRARVAIADLDAGIEDTAAEIARATGAEVIGRRMSLAERANVAALIGEVMERWGRLDILVNNAGGGVIRPFLDHTEESLHETLARNLWTTLWCSHVALPHMVQAGYGRIVNIGADSVRNGLWNHAAYNAAKGGVHGLTTGLAREFAAHDITVNTVAPCATNTPRARRIFAERPDLQQKYLSVIPKGRPAEMREIADMVCFLSSAESAFVTGQVISVNGGSAML